MKANEITYANIVIKMPYEMKQLHTLKIKKESGSHSIVKLTGMIDGDKKEGYITKAKSGDEVKITVLAEDESETVLFDGVVSSVGVRNIEYIDYVEVEAVSRTSALDIKKKSRSFQNKNGTYKDVVEEIVKEYEGVEFKDNATKNAKQEELIVQYNETDWQFIKRISSHFGAVLIPFDAAGKICFNIGSHSKNTIELDDIDEYTLGKNGADYLEALCSGTEAVENDYTYYTVVTNKIIEIGTPVKFRGKELIAAKAEGEITGGTLKFSYLLSPKGSFKQNKIVNKELTGAVMDGKVLEASGGCIKVHLSIDSEQDKEKAWLFPYATSYMGAGNTGWHFMPEKGDTVKIYFPNGYEYNAIANGSVRTGGSGQTVAPGVKYIGTKHGKNIMFGGKEMKITAKETKEGSIFIKFNNDTGIEVISDETIILNSEKDLEISGDRKISMTAGEGIYLVCKSSSISLDGTSNMKGNNIIAEGFTKSPVSVAQDSNSEDAETSEEKDDEMLLDGVQLALDVVGMIPVVGAVANVANAAISAARGDWGGAALSLFSCIPFAGAAAKGAKLAGTAVKAVNATAKGAKMMNAGAKAVKAVQNSKKIVKAASAMGKMTTKAMKVKDNIDKIEAVRQLAVDSAAALADGKLSAREMLTLGRDSLGLAGGKRKKINKSKKVKKAKCGDPVDMYTGSFSVEATDAMIEDRGLAFEFTRKYESSETVAGPMGLGWIAGFDSRLKINGDHLTAIYPDGCEEEFIKKGSEWEKNGNEDRSETLIENGDGYILNSVEKLIYSYDKEGKLLSVNDRNGNMTMMSYNSSGKLKSAMSPGGKEMYIAWTGTKITGIEDSLGRKTVFRYNGELLTEAVYPNGGTVKYTYKENLLTAITDQNGVTYVRNEYDTTGRVVKQYDNEGLMGEITYDDKENKRAYAYTKTGVIEYLRYDEAGNLCEKTWMDGTCEIYTYDSYGNENSVTDRNGNKHEKKYDNRGNVTAEFSPDGLLTTYTYDEANNNLSTVTTGGTEIHYSYDPRGNRIEDRVRIDETRFAVTRYEYDEYGRMTKRISPAGNETTYGYETKHVDVPTRVTDPEGNEVKYSYDETGRVESISTGYGTVKYSYDILNNKTSVTDANGATTVMKYDLMGNLIKKSLPGETENGWEYAYDYLDRLRKTIDPEKNVYALKQDFHGNLLKEINPDSYSMETDDGLGVEYVYDDSGRLIKTIFPDGGIKRTKYDANGNVTKIINAEYYDSETDDGLGMEYSYDTMDRLTTIRNSTGTIVKEYTYDLEGRITKETNARGYDTFYTYDLIGNLLKKQTAVEELIDEELCETTILYNATQYEYDTEGRLTRELKSPEKVKLNEIHAEWHKISYAYDRNNRVKTVTDSTGAEIHYTYDCMGNIRSERRKIEDGTYQTIHNEYDNLCNLVKQTEETDTGTAETKYSYDNRENVIKHVSPEGNETIMKYDMSDRLTEKHEEDRITKYRYDKSGNITEETDCNGAVTKHTYDLMNRRISTTDAEGNTDRIYYDSENNVIKYISAENYNEKTDNGAGTSCYYDAEGRNVKTVNERGITVEENIYDKNGELIGIKNANGNMTEYLYNISGLVTAVKTPEGRKQEYEYDSQGNITGITDGTGNKTKYTLDSWGRIRTILKPDNSIEEYSYNHTGSITGTKDGNNNRTLYSYNKQNQLSKITDPEGNSINYSYDKEGRLKEHRNRNGRILEYSYNRDNAVIKKREKQSNQTNNYEYNRDGTLSRAQNNEITYSYKYNKSGYLTAKECNGKQFVNYKYTKSGNISEISGLTGNKVNYEYDEAGRLSRITEDNKETITYTYNDDDTISTAEYINGVTTNYSYDKDQNITGITIITKDGTEILTHSYKYDANGNQTERTENGKTTKYEYDKLNRITKVTYPYAEEIFSYDKSGNRLSRMIDNLLTTYTYDKRNRLTRRQEGTKISDYSYDNEGNLVKENNIEYGYDSYNRNIYAKENGKLRQINRYDAEGMRYSTKEDGKVQNYIYHNGETLTETDERWNPISGYIRGYGLISTKDLVTKNNYYYHQNAHGDVVRMTNQNGRISNSYEYDVFGNTVEEHETIANRYCYSGEQYDRITNQYYLRARYYKPEIGRFTQEDPYRGDGLNLYSYVKNNPVRYIDPSGNSACDAKGKPQGSNKKTISKSHDNTAHDGYYGRKQSRREAYEQGLQPKKAAPKPINNAKEKWKNKQTTQRIAKKKLPDNLAGTFRGGKYSTHVLEKDIILYRAGTKDQPLGQFFSKNKPISEIQVRIDKAILPEWPGGAKSPIDTVYKVKIPKGTTIHIGQVAPQGGHYIGGTQQIIVEKPWLIEGVEVLDSFSIIK